ncbi:MAG: BolA/IbaG family iron-sulfur metabolism protein [Gammaproteobacteria bacterium]|nr:BolA/IbaG family iron-sulfur metabolism protein [Gammaproteobacteria bacterium]
MNEEQIQQAIENGIPGAQVMVDGDGRHFNATIVSEKFAGMKRLAQHRLVYDALGDNFATEALHALAIKTYTPEQWANIQGQ